MKTKFISIAATLLLAASFNTAFAARTVYNSSLNVNGTWYNCSSNNDWCSGGQFNGQNLGVLTELKIGGKAYSWNDDADWHRGEIYLGYKIDDGEDKSLAMSYIGWDGATNGMIFQSGGEPFVSSTITEFSNLTGGVHRIEIWFYNKDPHTGESGYDSNNGNNYVATFIKLPIPLANTTDIENAIDASNGAPIDVKLSGLTLHKNTTWNTLCLPFPLNSTQIEASPLAGADIYTLNQSELSENGILTLNFTPITGDGMLVGVPYLVRWNTVGNDVTDPIFNNVTLQNDYGPYGTSGGPIFFVGTLNSKNISGPNYLYLGAGNTLYWPNADVTIKPFHAYFELGEGITAGEPLSGQQGIKSFVLNFGDDNEETSIKQINNTESATNTYFTLDGRRLNDKPATAGLYIINGKKVVIK